MFNKKALTTVQAVLLIGIIIVVVVVAAFALGGSPTASGNDINVYIDSVRQDVNYTTPNELMWGSVQAGNTYTRNFTVENLGTQNLTLMLLTTEPAGTSQSWMYNNSLLPPNTYAAASLVLTLSTSPAGGVYTWRLLATNSTNPQATPTPAPSQTTTPDETYQFTINADTGAANINVTINTNKLTLMPNALPKTIIYHSGDTLSFKAVALDGYIFNYWEIPGETPSNSNPYFLASPHGNFTITATYIVNQTVT
jgi:hypothetical protein